jgi:hypothetical protein
MTRSELISIKVIVNVVYGDRFRRALAFQMAQMASDGAGFEFLRSLLAAANQILDNGLWKYDSRQATANWDTFQRLLNARGSTPKAL